MNALLRLNGIDAWQLAGWTMLHYLWLGMLAGLAAGALRLVLRRASANVRYIAALSCLAVLAALPVAITVWMGAQLQTMPIMANSVVAPSVEIAPSAPDSAGGRTGAAPLRSLTVNPPSIRVESPTVTIPRANPRQSRGLMNVAAIVVAYLPWLWILGTPLTFLLLTTGVIGSERLRRSSRIIHDGPIAEARTRLVEALHIGRSVTVAICERIAAPVLVGIVRPMILLPPAALTGWSPDEIEMVLLHELAHVRRWDNLVNLAQRLVEALLFFHPAVWLVSSWVRREREACCDAVVVGRTNRPHAYAELLLNLAAHIREPSEPGRPRPRSNAFRRGRGRPGSLVSSAMAAGPLRNRIRRILQLEDDPMLISGKSLAVVMSGLLLAATLVVLNLPSRTQAEESTTENTVKADLSVRDAGEDRAATQNNLKNLLLALLNYNDAEHGFPAVANFDANGRALLSWRVHLLPYLGEEALYKEFHLDEPWDSEHNRSLVTRMPKVFQNPRIDRPGVTNYLAVVGEECMFDDTAKGIRLAQVSDGTANTIAIVEANADRAVEWTSPRDWRFDREHPTAGLGTMWSGYWYAAWVDGHISQVLNSESPDHVGIQFTRACGERNSLAESAQNGGEEGTVGGGRGMAVIGEIGVSQSAQFATSRFPSLEDQKFTEVPFVVGASRFKNGDKIEILEVRGTAETIKPGNIYWIKGSYTLGSRDRAMLAAYTTAKDAANGTSPSLAVQSTNVDRGEGTFTLFLPMSFRGWPHVSFYPSNGGEGFGGIYFGTGDSVLNNWREVYGSDDTRSAESHAKVDRGKFPSLEDQKLADKIYRRMGLELEPIGEEDLKRVKALGYDGGLKTTHGAGGIQWSDILVGLHVWPTTRLKDVVDILNRDDLTELNPLKFYVVHRKQQYPDGSVGDEVVTGRISANVDQPRRIAPPSSTIEPQPAVAVDANHGSVQPPTAPTSDNSALRYDGKTFDEWRTAWQTELSTEKRLEMVKALAAFGASGWGREAAEAILNVTEQLDFSIMDHSSAGQLKLACVEAFVGGPSTGGYRIRTADWLPLLIKEIESKTSAPFFGTYVLMRIPEGQDDAIPTLLSLSEKNDCQSEALAGLKAIDPRLDDERVLARFRQALVQSNGAPDQLVNRIDLFLYSDGSELVNGSPKILLRFVPEIESLLFHPVLEVRQSARIAITHIRQRDAPILVKELMQIVDDDSNADRVESIRALAAMGDRAKSAESKLKQIAHTESDPGRFAAALAIMRIRPEVGDWGDGKYAELFGEAGRKPENYVVLRRGLEDESKGLFPVDANRSTLGGGGGIF